MHENFFHKLKVYYEDTDSGGVVYYANYLKFLERARTEALFSIGYSNKKIQDLFNSLIIVKSCNIEFKKISKLEDKLQIYSSIKSFDSTPAIQCFNIRKAFKPRVKYLFVKPSYSIHEGEPSSIAVPGKICRSCLMFGVIIYKPRDCRRKIIGFLNR